MQATQFHGKTNKSILNEMHSLIPLSVLPANVKPTETSPLQTTRIFLPAAVIISQSLY